MKIFKKLLWTGFKTKDFIGRILKTLLLIGFLIFIFYSVYPRKSKNYST